jgi:hypothetical protein
MLTVTLPREGRAGARAATSAWPPPAAESGAERPVVGGAGAAVGRGRPRQTLAWGYSVTIERVLIDRHVQRLAERLPDHRPQS